MKNCPHCGKAIKDESIKCRYCHEWLDKKNSMTPASGEEPQLDATPSEINQMPASCDACGYSPLKLIKRYDGATGFECPACRNFIKTSKDEIINEKEATEISPMENTSGQGKQAIIPEEIKGWSWGAFLMSPFWGLFNGTYIALLSWIPFVGIVMMIILGVKGNEWAWRNERWDNVQHFKRAQKKWAIAGLILYGIAITVIITAFVIEVSLRRKGVNYGWIDLIDFLTLILMGLGFLVSLGFYAYAARHPERKASTAVIIFLAVFFITGILGLFIGMIFLPKKAILALLGAFFIARYAIKRAPAREM